MTADFNRIMLIPGFLSPQWMLTPLYRYLSKRRKVVELWDHPRVLTDPQLTANALADRLHREAAAGCSVALVTHSFGDWIGRAALATAAAHSVSTLVSIGPVVTASPMARLLSCVGLALTPELRVMADREVAARHLHLAANIDHTVLWARWDAFVTRPSDWPQHVARQITFSGTHNSIVVRRGLWRLVNSCLVAQPDAVT